MTYAIPVIDLENVQLEAVRAGTEELGAVQVVNHGVLRELSEDLGRRTARLLGLPRAEKARLASPHPYRGWRQWPDDFGRLELERFNVAQFDTVAEASAAGAAVRAWSRSSCGTTSRTGWPTTWPPTADRSRSRPGATARRTSPSWRRTRRAGSGRARRAPAGEGA